MKRLNVKALAEIIRSRAESDIKEKNICITSIAVISPDERCIKHISTEDKLPLNDLTLFGTAWLERSLWHAFLD